MAGLAALIWARALNSITSTRSFGPIITILKIMTANLLEFILLWSFLIVFYMCVGMLLFYEVPAFKLRIDAFQYLLYSALGNWDLTIFEKII
jgi:hypothetical protein